MYILRSYSICDEWEKANILIEVCCSNVTAQSSLNSNLLCSPHQTLYLELRCPAIRPALLLISDSGHNTIHFNQVAVGNKHLTIYLAVVAVSAFIFPVHLQLFYPCRSESVEKIGNPEHFFRDCKGIFLNSFTKYSNIVILYITLSPVYHIIMSIDAAAYLYTSNSNMHI